LKRATTSANGGGIAATRFRSRRTTGSRGARLDLFGSIN
jgi:hypothetical protein